MTTGRTKDQVVPPPAFDEDEDQARWRQAYTLAETLLKTASEIPEATLDATYRELRLSPVLADLVRAGAGIERDGDHLNLLSDRDVPDKLTQQVKDATADFTALLLPAPPAGAVGPSETVAKAILIGARYVGDHSKYALLTTKETQVYVTAMGIAFAKALRSMVEANHPGDVQGTA